MSRNKCTSAPQTTFWMKSTFSSKHVEKFQLIFISSSGVVRRLESFFMSLVQIRSTNTSVLVCVLSCFVVYEHVCRVHCTENQPLLQQQLFVVLLMCWFYFLLLLLFMFTINAVGLYVCNWYVLLVFILLVYFGHLSVEKLPVQI